jgi:hypothetical protein
MTQQRWRLRVHLLRLPCLQRAGPGPCGLSSVDSDAAIELLSGVSVGKLSVQHAQLLVQCIQNHMQRLGCTPAEAIQGLAGLGNYGRSLQNCERDLADRKDRHFQLACPTMKPDT